MSAAQLLPGTVVDQAFTVGDPYRTRPGAYCFNATDSAGQSVVLTAYDRKCFPSSLVLERSLRELRQLQGVQSPRIAPVLACGRLGDGELYEVNPPLPPLRIDERLAEQALSATEAAALIEQIGEGLLEAQKLGVLHRNLGPRVIYLGSDGAVLTGFAVGEPLGEDSYGPLDTLAPEQADGKVVDQRTLIYNLAALMHMMLTGSPLYGGEAAEQRSAHRSSELPTGVHMRLRRALGKDPRMRPMMLKLFLAELRTIGGGAAPAPRAPSAAPSGNAPPLPGAPVAPAPATASTGVPRQRGWTMFVKEGEDEQEQSPATTSASEAPPVVEQGAAAPKTRGWTMFMQAAEDEGESSEQQDKGGLSSVEKPSTRGWTMFTEDDEAEPEAEPPGPPAQVAQPKTRGWTMFTEDDEAEAEPEVPVEAEADAPLLGADEAEGEAAQPSTRGWTMFMTAADGEEQPSEVEGAEPEPDPPAVPKTRGWTMFTDDDDEAATAVADPQPDASVPTRPAAGAEPAAAVPTAASSVPAAVEPRVAPPSEPAAASGKKRGWTVFMDKPLDEPIAAPTDASVRPAADARPVPAPSGAPSASSPSYGSFKRPVPSTPLVPSSPAAAHPASQASAGRDASSASEVAPDQFRKTVFTNEPPPAGPSEFPMQFAPPAGSDLGAPRDRTMVAPVPNPGAPPSSVMTPPASGQVPVPSSGSRPGDGGPPTGPSSGSLPGPIHPAPGVYDDGSAAPRPHSQAVAPARGRPLPAKSQSNVAAFVAVGLVAIVIIVVAVVMLS